MVDFKKSSHLLLDQFSCNPEKLVTVIDGEAGMPRNRFNNTLIQGMKMDKMKSSK